MSELNRNLLRGFISVLSGDVGGVLVGLIVTPLLVRALGSGQYGDYAFMLSALSVLVVLTNAGISDGVRKFIAEDRGTEWAEYVFGFYTRVAIALAGVTGLCIFAAVKAGLVDAVAGPAFRQYFYLLAILVGARQLFLTLRSTLMGLGYEHYSEPLTVLRKMLFGIFGVMLALLGYGVTGVLVGHILASSLGTIVAVTVLGRRLDLRALWQRAPTTLQTEPRELLSFNALSVVLTLLMMSLYHVDILLLRPLEGGAATGYYRAALLVAEFVWFAPFALQMALLHSTSELWAEGRLEELSALAAKATRYTLALTLIVALGIAALVDAFVPLYFGAEFVATGPIVLLLLPGAFGLAVARPIFAIGQGKGDLRILIVATGTAAVLNLVLNLLLIPPYGMRGAAVATSIGYGLMVVLHVVSARRIGFNPIADLRLVRLGLVGIGAGVAVFGLARLIDTPILALGVVPPVGAVLYAVGLLRLGVVRPAELEPIFMRLPSRVADPLERIVGRVSS
ncbi:oligosaccharide flippase family protein [Haloarcula halophila]|uniref:oligosaccharide flippase family protein n=1 Tax=Haloarcula TaxID=2237 RepID=UPI0023E3AC0D|nr:polysaccharide biosynthesis C-terminal domain-containing protein [Halomicroarcula sp. DFY41]